MGIRRLGCADDQTIGLAEHRREFLAPIEPIDAERGRAGRIVVPPHGDDARARARHARNFLPDAARADDRHRSSGELGAAEAQPAPGLLLLLKPADLFAMKEEGGEDELGKWLSVNAAGGCYDDLRVLQSEPLHEWSNAGRGRCTQRTRGANSSSSRDSF